MDRRLNQFSQLSIVCTADGCCCLVIGRVERNRLSPTVRYGPLGQEWFKKTANRKLRYAGKKTAKILPTRRSLVAWALSNVRFDKRFAS